MKEEPEKLKDLGGIPKKEPFEAPEGYFEGFNDRLRDRISAEHPSSAPNLAIRMALVLSCLVAVIFLFRDAFQPFDNTKISSSNTELIESDYLNSIDEEQLQEAYAAMFHEAQTEPQEEEMLREIDEELLTNSI